MLSNDAANLLNKRSLVSIDDFADDAVASVLTRAAQYKKQILNNDDHTTRRLRPLSEESRNHFVVGLLFFEPSTRTRSSFEAAIKRLGGSSVTLSDVSSSSTVKGESLEDTARMMEGYCDALVVRHSEVGAVLRVRHAVRSSFPVINAGDGSGEHPTQALLDLFTIEENFPSRLQIRPSEYSISVAPLVVTVVGDLLHGRTVHSLCRLLARYNSRLQFLAPKGLGLSSKMKADIRDTSVRFRSVLPIIREVETLEEALQTSDVLYMTRIQKERHNSSADENKNDEAVATTTTPSFILTREALEKHAKAGLIVMHPLPRVDEIACDVDGSENQRYFAQAQNGMFVRMALFA